MLGVTWRKHLDELYIFGAAGAGHMGPPSFCNLHSNAANSAAPSMYEHTLPSLHLCIV